MSSGTKYGPWHGIISDAAGYKRQFIVRRIGHPGGGTSTAITIYDRHRDTRGAIVRYATLQGAQRRADALNGQSSSSPPNDTASRNR